MNSADSAMQAYCNDEAIFYLQAPCVIRADKVKFRKLMGLVVATISVFVILFSVTFIDYTKGVQAFQYVDFDFKTLSTGDYTVQFNISKNMYDTFLNTYHD